MIPQTQGFSPRCLNLLDLEGRGTGLVNTSSTFIRRLRRHHLPRLSRRLHRRFPNGEYPPKNYLSTNGDPFFSKKNL